MSQYVYSAYDNSVRLGRRLHIWAYGNIVASYTTDAMEAKLEDCQTLRHHAKCATLHSQPIISDDASLVRNVPLLALVMAFELYLKSNHGDVVFPTLDSSVSCRGDLVVMGTKADVGDPSDNIWESYALLVGSSISASVDTKDEDGYAISFGNLVAPYMDEIVRALTANDLIVALGKLREKLEKLE